MRGINLLPWRQELKQFKNRKFYIMLLFSLSITFFVICFFHYYFIYKINGEERKIALLEKEEKKIKKTIQEIDNLEANKFGLLKRIEIIQNIEKARFSNIQVLDTLPRVMPPGIALTKLEKKGQKIELQGIGKTNAAISFLLRNFEKSESKSLFQLVKLKEVSTDKKTQDLLFRMEFPIPFKEILEEEETQKLKTHGLKESKKSQKLKKIEDLKEVQEEKT